MPPKTLTDLFREQEQWYSRRDYMLQHGELQPGQKKYDAELCQIQRELSNVPKQVKRVHSFMPRNSSSHLSRTAPAIVLVIIAAWLLVMSWAAVIFMSPNNFGSLTAMAVAPLPAKAAEASVTDYKVQATTTTIRVQGESTGNLADLYARDANFYYVYQFKWNISAIPQNMVIENATMCLYAYVKVGAPDNDLRIWRLPNYTWSESEMDGSGTNFDSQTGTIVNETNTTDDGIVVSSTSVESWHCINVSEQVRTDYGFGKNSSSIRVADPDSPMNDAVGAFTISEIRWPQHLTEFYYYTRDTGSAGNNTPFLNITYTDTADNPPTVTLQSPADGNITYVSNDFSTLFNCSATDDSQLVNITLYLTDRHNTSTSFAANITKGMNGTSNATSFTVTLQRSGNYTWNCLAFDNAATPNSQFATKNRTFELVVHAPKINSVVYLAPFFNKIIWIRANVTDPLNDLVSVNFTVVSPTGAFTLTNANASNYRSDNWNSSNFTLNEPSAWNYTIIATDAAGLQERISANITWNGTLNISLVTPLAAATVTANQSFTFSVNVTCRGANCSRVNVTLDPEKTPRFKGGEPVAGERVGEEHVERELTEEVSEEQESTGTEPQWGSQITSQHRSFLVWWQEIQALISTKRDVLSAKLVSLPISLPREEQFVELPLGIMMVDIFLTMDHPFSEEQNLVIRLSLYSKDSAHPIQTQDFRFDGRHLFIDGEATGIKPGVATVEKMPHEGEKNEGAIGTERGRTRKNEGGESKGVWLRLSIAVDPEKLPRVARGSVHFPEQMTEQMLLPRFSWKSPEPVGKVMVRG